MSNDGPVLALGAMSGTSMDGVDAAVIETDGRRILSFGETAYRAYSETERQAIRGALGRDAEAAAVERAAEVVETAHAALLAPMPGELVGFHGQTLWHAPEDGLTCQAGDGDVLAEVLGRTVVWDFRTSDMELGGQGAPLASFYHHACARWAGIEAPVGFLNLGGVGNLTWVDPRIEAPELPGACLAFDTGPANGPIDDLVVARLGKACDAGGALAAQGAVADDVPERFLEHRYFRKVPPKSLDRNDFPELAELVAELSDADAAATLAAVAAASVMAGMEHCPSPPSRVLVTGGGRKNPVLMAMIAAGLDCPVGPVEEVGLDGDMLEAQAFAYLAVRVLRGLPTTAPGTTGVAAPVGGGRVSRPGKG